MKKIIVVSIVVLVIFGFLIYFVSSRSASSTDTQKVIISMKNGNYYPNTITVKANQPVEITLDSSVGGCYRSFVIPQFGVNKNSQNSGDKITFTPTEKGTFQFRCGMGMGRGILIVE